MTSPRIPEWLVSRCTWIALALLAVAFAATQFAAVFTESVNWDEFALFHRTERSASTGTLQGGGRPGLASVAIIPFVQGCTDTMATIVRVRLVWAAITLSMLAALFVLLRGAVRAPEHRLHAAALGVAMVGLVPVFMRWSVQVRTDQPAIAAALWASVALLASRRRPRLAAVAGALFVVGFLFSQKALYVAALGGLIVLGDLVMDAPVGARKRRGAQTALAEATAARRNASREGGAGQEATGPGSGPYASESRRIVWRVAWLTAGAAIVILAWRVTMFLLYGTMPPTAGLGAVLNVFDYYRERFGYRVYLGMLPSLYPHLASLVLLLLALRVAYRRRTAQLRPLLVALAVAALGLAVGVFHAGAFPYFWMTLGLFPACAIALGWPGVAATWPRASKPLAIGLWAWMLIVAIPYRLEVLEDTQAVQRDTFAFIDRNFDMTARGFHADGGLFCRRDPRPMPVYLHEHVERAFGGPDGDLQADLFVAEFRIRPIAFMIDDLLLHQFPAKVLEFWSTHYVPYHGAAAVAGRRLRGPAGMQVAVDIILAGDYRWSGPGAISIDGRRLDAGATIRLSTGGHAATIVEGTPGGVLSLALPDPPRPGRTPFHAWGPVAEIGGARLEW